MKRASTEFPTEHERYSGVEADTQIRAGELLCCTNRSVRIVFGGCGQSEYSDDAAGRTGDDGSALLQHRVRELPPGTG